MEMVEGEGCAFSLSVSASVSIGRIRQNTADTPPDRHNLPCFPGAHTDKRHACSRRICHPLTRCCQGCWTGATRTYLPSLRVSNRGVERTSEKSVAADSSERDASRTPTVERGRTRTSSFYDRSRISRGFNRVYRRARNRTVAHTRSINTYT